MTEEDEIFDKKEPEDVEEVEDFKKYYIKAGKLAHDAREKSKKWIKPGVNLYELARKIEEEIKDNIGFPTDLSVNENAAHQTPDFKEETVISEKDVIKVDIGTQVDGFIGDTAYTVDLSGENSKLVEASEKALENALSILKDGVNTRDIGAEIERTIKSYGFKPIENLSGHGLEQYEVHANYNIPNVKTADGVELSEGEIFAIEPFATTGSGRIKEGLTTNIFSLAKPINVRNTTGREILAFTADKYGTLPFAERWLVEKWNALNLKLALRELITRGAFQAYPVLHDVKGSLVSQAEVTVLLEKDSCRVLT